MNKEPSSYGAHLWLVICQGDPAYYYADRIELDDSGTLALISDVGLKNEMSMPINIFARGEWETVDLVHKNGDVVNMVAEMTP